MVDWYAPEPLLQTVRSVMGDIDIDPTSYEDGLTRPWPGRVWLMPPFGRTRGKSNQEIWTARLIEQYAHGITQEAILMVPACTAAKWFYPLYGHPIVFSLGRIRCVSLTRQASHPTKGSAFVYFGHNTDAFKKAFVPAWGTAIMRASREGNYA